MVKDANLNTEVMVAMSGGVDSSVAAAMLVEKGYRVSGVMMRTQDIRVLSDVKKNAEETARKIAEQLQIQFRIFEVSAEFQKQVIKYFIDSHATGLTPNPCYICNRAIKWGLLLDYVLDSGAQKLASGHYAQVSIGEAGLYKLHMAVDKNKDQSYVLSALTQSQLQHAMFPLGGMHKQEVRTLARSYNFPIEDDDESQDLCFLEGQSQKEFLKRHAPGLFLPGLIKTVEGRVVGEHQGLALFTIGQRKGIQISHSEPYYIIRKELDTNTLIIGSRASLGIRRIKISHVNWISDQEPPLPACFQVKIRYRAKAIKAWITGDQPTGYNITFDEVVRDPTPGQYAVFYDDDEVIGSGVITEILAGEN